MSRFLILCALVVATTASLTSGAAGSSTAKQRIAIEEKSTATASGTGTFRLIPLSAGPLKADSGTFTWTGGQSGSQTIRKGQRLTAYKGVDVLKGKHGTLRIPNDTFAVDAGGGYGAATQTWSIAGGSGAYAHLSGGGAGANVGTPQGTVFGRYEGYVKR